MPHPPSIPEEHRRAAPASVNCGVVTISDTRTLEEDRGGALLVELLVEGGHTVVGRELVPDDPQQIEALLRRWAGDARIDAVLMTGGTGISPRDHTYETVSGLLTKTLPGYGELFRMLSYQEIGAAAMLSRTLGGVVDQTVVLTMPGSPAAVRLAAERLIVPELGHLVREAQKPG